jgi:hypothetical protein
MMGVSSSSSLMSRTMMPAGTKWSWILTITSLAMPFENQIDWSTIYNCIFIGYKDLLPNKYSYVTLDIMVTPDPMSQKVLWKILCPMVHSIVGTPGSSFLARNGWSEEVVILILECVDHINYFFLWLSSPVLPPSLIVLLLLGHCCLFG